MNGYIGNILELKQTNIVVIQPSTIVFVIGYNKKKFFCYIT